MLSVGAMEVPEAAVAEVKAYLRLFAADEDALVGTCLASAAGLCERFTGQAMLTRAHEEMLGGGGWTMLGAAPVRAIDGVAEIGADGEASPLPGGAYLVDIDAAGRGWVRVAPGGAARVRVTYQAGLAAAWDGLPEALRHGIVRLAAHLFTERGGDAAPPAAVSALWRPWRQMRIGGRDVRAD